ncbi:glycosyltransferase involved in cell wall biosynthesis [Paenibacillus shirakamiensis]|uniref:Glycosyltransferase involved in cell wall biosynthesis n=1 Tax=Paenibacillus shirakamiensis TaxID=1265935 RepID=A0ABS4JED1_9BACL|nr:glycosyltransferase family 2 protein [Paenibacillus shirakamiensis]MBP2000053.1 glycosyltransferase involved in cell wall biosynthesis [Paenibacillus shirakamiensis]
MEPLISIVMPTYNRAHIISGAIESILRQSYANWELIVVDDRSTDHTKEMIKEWTTRELRIHYVCNEREKGPGGARNTGMLAAKGEYLAFLDSDDEWYPNHLSDSLRTHVLTNAEISFALWVEQHGETISYNFDRPIERNLLQSMGATFGTAEDGATIIFEKGLFEAFLSHTRNFFQLNTMVFRKRLLDEVGLINEQFYLGEDTTYLLRFFDNYRIALQTKPHSIYRESPDSLYFFCDRWQLDPDTIHLNQDIYKKIEGLSFKSIKVREHIRNMVIQSSSISKKSKQLSYIDMGISSKYFTLSYLNRYDRNTALYYCRQSLRYKITIFNLFLYVKLLSFSKKGHVFLHHALNLW